MGNVREYVPRKGVVAVELMDRHAFMSALPLDFLRFAAGAYDSPACPFQIFGQSTRRVTEPET